MLELVHSGADGQQERAAGALWFLTFGNGANQDRLAAKGVGPLVTLVRSGAEGQRCIVLRCAVLCCVVFQ